MSANDPEEFVKREIDWISVPLNENKPYLGICLGAQMLVKNLGGTVGPDAKGLTEIGWYPLRPTEHGRLLMSWPRMVYHFHREGFSVPRGVKLLAEGDAYPHQAIRYGENAWGVQFHAELTRAMMQSWVVRGASRFVMPNAQQGREHLEGRMLFDTPLRAWLWTIWISSSSAPNRKSQQRRSTPKRRKSALCRRIQIVDLAQLGETSAQMIETASVPKPPMTTAGTAPTRCAMVPARNSPSSLEAPTKTMFTALTRPRTSSGVQSMIRLSRT